MRKVIYSEWVHGTPGTDVTNNKGYSIDKIGWFHGFGQNYTTCNDGSLVNYTEAFVECEDGKIITIDPTLIRFVDSPETDQLAEFAKVAMVGLLANNTLVRSHSSEVTRRGISEHAILQAKSMIEELKKLK